jgi:hypothetical protein
LEFVLEGPLSPRLQRGTGFSKIRFANLRKISGGERGMKRIRACNFLDFSKFNLVSPRKITKIVEPSFRVQIPQGVYH